MRWAALGFVLAGCLHGKSHQCPTENGETWVCPEDEACASPPTYCGTANEVGACDNKMERDPCSTTLVPDGLCISDVCSACSNDIAGCRYVGWKGMTSPTGVYLNAIAFADFGEAYAGAADGTVLRYDISAWTVDPRFPADGNAVIGMVAAGSKVYALKINNTVVELDGGMWTTLTTVPGSFTYSAIWATETDVFLAGPNGSFAHFDGASWGAPWSAAGMLNTKALWGTSATDLYAAGLSVGVSAVSHWDGATWMALSTPPIGPLKAVWAIGNEVFAAGSNAKIIHGTNLTLSTLDLPATLSIAQLWGSSATDVFAVGTGGVIAHWDGTAWVSMNVSSNADLAAVSGSSGSEVFAVGMGGAIERYTGLGWADLAMQPTTSSLDSIYAASSNEVFAVGKSASVFHYKGETLATEPSAPPLSHNLAAVWGRSATDVFAIGSQATATHFDGTWTTQTGAPVSTITTLWGDASTVYAAGAFVYKFNGSAWSQIVTTNIAANGIWIAPSGKIWIADLLGISHVEGTGVVFDVMNAKFNAIWGAGENDIFAAGEGEIRHYDGTSWTAMTTPAVPSLTGVWGRASDDVFAVGAASTVLHYHAGEWRTVDPSTTLTTDISAVSGAGTAIYVAGGVNGKVYRLLETSP